MSFLVALWVRERFFMCLPANLIIDGLWLGNEESSKDREFLDREEISDILVAGHCLMQYFPLDKEYLLLTGMLVRLCG